MENLEIHHKFKGAKPTDTYIQMTILNNIYLDGPYV